jgi:ubiquinone/menaquinone biosynthesis C-methylase UbiE
MDECRRANLNLWNEWTQIHAQGDTYGLQSFKAGRNELHPLEISELGPVAGKSLLHLQCHFGLDTLSWARRGALVTGIDFSDQAIDLARSISAECSIPASFICCDLYDLPNHLDKTFDIVFTSYGVLTWLSDLTTWAQLAARYLKPGGIFYIAEFHPASDIFDENADKLQIAYPYFNPNVEAYPVQGSYADREAVVRQAVEYGWTHPLGEVITSLIQAGLSLEFVHEFPFNIYQGLALLEQAEDGYWYLPGKAQTIPLLYSIRAVKH